MRFRGCCVGPSAGIPRAPADSEAHALEAGRDLVLQDLWPEKEGRLQQPGHRATHDDGVALDWFRRLQYPHPKPGVGHASRYDIAAEVGAMLEKDVEEDTACGCQSVADQQKELL